jgi:hypothetical protein
MRRVAIFSLFAVVAMLSACATVPTSPSVMVLPGSGKSFDQFRADDAVCRQFAYEQAGGAAGQQAAQKSAVTSAAVGTAVGAAAGAAIGAGTGLLVGSAAGSSAASESYYEGQRRYDYAYMQCMYAKGNQIPGYRGYTSPPASEPRGSAPPPPDYPPPSDPDNW